MSDILGLTPRGDGQEPAGAFTEPSRDALGMFAPEVENARADRADVMVIDPAPVAAVSPIQREQTQAVLVPVAVPVAAGDHHLALDQVLARLGHVEWPEAVAIVEAACTVLRAAGNETTAPEIGGLAITALGNVRATGRASGASGPALARILHALTAGRPLPVQLRLFVTKWVSSGEPHSTTEFAGELNYFVRPGGAALIAAVYQRALAAAPATQAVAQMPPAESASKMATPAASARPRWGVAAAMVGIAAAGVLCLVLWGDAGPSTRTGAAIDITSWISGSIQAIQSATASLRERIGFGGVSGGSPAGAPTATQTAEAQPGTPVTRPARPAARPAASPSATAPRATTVSPVAAPDAKPVAAPEAPSAVVQQPPIENTSSPASPSFQAEADAVPKIYSSADADVTPPFLVSPKLPRPLVSGTNPSINMMELIVSESGTVQQVRLLSPPRRMADMMLLSGAKAWRFEPASRAGESVRYRLLLTWDTTP